MSAPQTPAGRAGELITTLQLVPHPEGGWYREIFRGAGQVRPADGGALRSTLTSIDFLLVAGQHSAWHRVASDEAWHLLEGGPLRLWLMPPALDRIESVDLAAADRQGRRPRHVVPANWWQAAEPLPGAGFAYVGATVGPGFDFADFSFGRDEPALRQALQALRADLLRLL
ncbi:MAG: cupin domain-containing protein [Burkholderiaceae bacterium]|nr:cupin domain-containing protein [Burkholderiaceae bacterium]